MLPLAPTPKWKQKTERVLWADEIDGANVVPQIFIELPTSEIAGKSYDAEDKMALFGTWNVVRIRK